MTARDPPVEELIETVVEEWLACPPEPWRRRDDDIFPDYDDEPVMAAACD